MENPLQPIEEARFSVRLVKAKSPLARATSMPFMNLELARQSARFISDLSKTTTYVMNCKRVEAIFRNGVELQKPNG